MGGLNRVRYRFPLKGKISHEPGQCGVPAVEQVQMGTACLQHMPGPSSRIKKPGCLGEGDIVIFNTVDDYRGCSYIFKFVPICKMKLQQPFCRQEPISSAGDLVQRVKCRFKDQCGDIFKLGDLSGNPASQ